MATGHVFSTLEACSAPISGIVMLSSVSQFGLSQVSICRALQMFLFFSPLAVQWLYMPKGSGEENILLKIGFKDGACWHTAAPVPRRAAQRSLRSSPASSGALLPAVWKL